jgi:HlyD family secretion protein
LRAELALDDVRRDLERKRALVLSAVVSTSEWERIQNGHRSAQAQADAARAQEASRAWELRAATAALRMAEAQLANNRALVKHKEAALRQARTDLDRTFIRAPVTGTVINRSVSQGQTVAASLQAPTLFTIAQDLTRMQVHASVVEADVGRIATGQRATFTVDAHPGRLFTGEVAQIRMAPQVVQNVVTYIVVISVENADAALFPGMTANLRVVVAEKDGILRVPNTALRFRPADAPPLDANSSATAGPGVPGRVFVLGSSGEPVEVPLRLGATDGRITEVLAGELVEGQAVLTGTARATSRAERTSWIPAKLRLL